MHYAKFTSIRQRTIDESWKTRLLFLVAVSSGTLLNPLNSSMISMALHPIQHAFHTSFTTASWVISSFYIASAVGQPVMGKIGDAFGRKKVFIAGLLIAALAALAAPFITVFSLLVFLRVLQAVGTSSIYPSGMGLVRKHIQTNQAFALSLISIFSSVTVALGPTIGGFAIAAGGWPAIFTINLPFLLLSFVLSWIIFPKDDKREERHISSLLQQLDVPGIVLFASSLLLLLSFLLSLKTSVQYGSGITGLVLLLAFIYYELRVEQPFIDLRMFLKNPALTKVNVLFVMLNVYNYALLFGLPTYFQDEMGLGMKTTGLLMLFISGFGIIVSPLTGKWVDRAGVMRPLLLGSVLMLVGALLLTFTFTIISWQWVIPVLSIMGMGYGFNNVSLQTAMLRSSSKEEIGVSSGLFQTSRYMGAIVSSALLGYIFGRDITAFHMQIIGFILIGVSVISILMSFRFARV